MVQGGWTKSIRLVRVVPVRGRKVIDRMYQIVSDQFYFVATQMFTYQPLWLPLALWAAFLVFFQFRSPLAAGQAMRLSRFWPVTAGCLVANYFGMMVFYFFSDNFSFPWEVPVIIKSYLVLDKPIYTMPGDPERISIVWGPALYLINKVFLVVLRPSFLSAKLWGVLAATISMVLLFRHFRRETGTRVALVILSVMTLYFLSRQSITFSLRGDSTMLLVAAGSLFSLQHADRRWAFPLIGFLAGLALNIKFHGVLYVAPVVLAMLEGRWRWANLVGMGLAFILSAIFPFLLPNVSLKAYLFFLGELSRVKWAPHILQNNLEWLALYSAPLWLSLIAYFQGSRKSLGLHLSLTLLLLGLSAVTVSVIGARPGSAHYQLIPFAPFMAHLGMVLWRDHIDLQKLQNLSLARLRILLAAALAVAVFFLAQAAAKEVYEIQNLTRYPGRAIVSDLDAICSRYPRKTIHMGYGSRILSSGEHSRDAQYVTYYRPYLMFKGHPFWLDYFALIDFAMTKAYTWDPCIRKLEEGGTDIWLIPRDNAPFYYRNDVGEELFPDIFRTTFLTMYEKKSHSEFYDIWGKKVSGNDGSR